MSRSNSVCAHHKIWPKRLPRELVVPRTTLWFNLEVSARRYPVWLGPAAWLGAGVIRVWGRSWRRVTVPEGAPGAAPRIYVFWHAGLLALTFTHRGRGGAVLISRHADGELIARTIERLGFVTARGSSTRGGGRGLLELMARAAEGCEIGITPDGPRGPARRFKPGAILLASRTGLPIVPIGVGARRERRLRSWDGFRLPAPFTRVAIVYGPPTPVPADLGGEAMEAWCARAGAALDAVTERAEALARSGS